MSKKNLAGLADYWACRLGLVLSRYLRISFVCKHCNTVEGQSRVAQFVNTWNCNLRFVTDLGCTSTSILYSPTVLKLILEFQGWLKSSFTVCNTTVCWFYQEILWHAIPAYLGRANFFSPLCDTVGLWLYQKKIVLRNLGRANFFFFKKSSAALPLIIT